jgi:hypothetical protein
MVLSRLYLIYYRYKLKIAKGHLEREETSSEIDLAPSFPIWFQLKFKK